jgi:hypothetical protein
MGNGGGRRERQERDETGCGHERSAEREPARYYAV